jgi:hypothetical protein
MFRFVLVICRVRNVVFMVLIVQSGL